MKRLKFAEFTSCENFRGYCGPILHGVKGMGKKCGLCFLFLGFFQYWLLNKLMYRERLKLNKISRFGTFFPSISSLFFPLVSSSSSIFFFIKIILSVDLENSTRSI